MSRLVLATHNIHKAEELSALLQATGIEILTLEAFPQIKDIVEDRDTLEGNAVKKAREIFRQTNLPSLADDTGLEVFSLNGAPGVFSARYAGENATYAENCRKLLIELNNIPHPHRDAQFRCVLAFVAPGGTERIVEGVCWGTIIEGQRGTQGFGYDPLFVPTGCDQTFAEMSLDLKNTVSHRAKALRQMKGILLEYFNFPENQS